MLDTLGIGLAAAVQPLEHSEPAEQLVLAVKADERVQNSSFEVQHQLMHQLSVAVLPVANNQPLGPMAVA